MFRYMNANPNKRNIDDCTIRAISVAEGISWDSAYKKLSNTARKMGLMMDSAVFIESYLDEHYERIYDDSEIVADVIENNPIGTYLVTMKGHITVIKDGILYDTFDCSERTIQDIWEVD